MGNEGSVQTYRKKPVVINAIQWNGTNSDAVLNFCNDKAIIAALDLNNDSIIISTLEGMMTASIGDYIIKGVNGEFYPCKPDIFKKTYDFYRENEK